MWCEGDIQVHKDERFRSVLPSYQDRFTSTFSEGQA